MAIRAAGTCISAMRQWERMKGMGRKGQRKESTPRDNDHAPAEESMPAETLTMLPLSVMETTTVTEKTHAWGLQNVMFINKDLELLVS